MGKCLFLLLSLYLYILPLSAQVNSVEIFFADINKSEICKKNFSSSDTLAVFKLFNDCLSKYFAQGYVEARIDSIQIDSLGVKAYAIRGDQYSWILLSSDSTSQLYLKEAGLNLSRITRKPLSPSSFATISQRVLNHFDDRGYPFARVSFYNSTIQENSISSTINIDKGPHIVLDTLYIKGDARIAHRFIESYLGFSKGEPYREKQVRGYDSRIRKLGFLSVIRPSEVEYIPGRARVYTYITNQRASQFSGLVGFSSRDDNSNRLQFTGDVNLRLVNVFRQGERNQIQWQALGEGTQRLNLSSAWSYIMGSKVGFNTQFKLFRRDTSYLNLNPKFALNFHMQNGSHVGLGFDLRSSRTLVGENNLSNFSTSLYQISYSSDIHSQEVFPLKSFWFSGTAGVGTRKSNQNSSTVGEIQAMIMGYRPVLSSNLVMHLKLQGEVMRNISPAENQSLFMENELYRIGGMGNLRGFNQESILSDAYSIASAELQYRVQNLLNFYAFIDKAYVSQVVSTSKIEAWPLGVGFGFQVVTAGGILNLSYAMGSGLGEELALRNAKIHVGYMANF